MRTIHIIVGTRPNFIKVTQFKKEAKIYTDLEVKIIHTGQHYDDKMATIFFDQFNLRPDHFLDIRAGNPGSQIGEIISKLSEYFRSDPPDLVIVVGDVNSTLAAAIAANKASIPLAHLESGLRSRDRTMPEEINRILTDEISDFCFVTEPSGEANLKAEGKSLDQIFYVGNTMIDTLVHFQESIEKSSILRELNLNSQDFFLMTMHRPANVDNISGLKKIVALIDKLTTSMKVVFPIHPRTLQRFTNFGLESQLDNNPNLILLEPLDYFAFQNLVKHAHFVITDSGGIQEETSFCGIPCVTLRQNTERPITCDMGTNILMDFDLDAITTYINGYQHRKLEKLPLWDGNATQRIMKHIASNVLGA